MWSKERGIVVGRNSKSEQQVNGVGAYLGEELCGKSASVSTRHLSFVSDSHSTDEIEALLYEIQDLDLVSDNTEDWQDGGEIDGSVRFVPRCSRSSMTCDSRASVHSWDSHALYSTHNNRMDDVSRRSVGGPVSLYCNSNHLRTPIGILRIILLVTSVVCLGLLCTSGTAVYGLFSLPFVSRIRLLLFVNLFAILVTLLLLFLDITLLHYAFPFHYHRMAVSIYLTECAAFVGSSGLIIHLTQIYEHSFPGIAKVTRDQLIASSVFGLVSGLVALLLAVYGLYEICHLHVPKREDTDQLTLTERARQQINNYAASAANNAKYFEPEQPPEEPAISATVWPIDDVQPCSSKHAA